MSGRVAKTFSEIIKFNPYHDARGRFTNAGGAASMTLRTRSALWQGAADKAIARHKERTKANETKAIEIESPDGTKLSYRVNSKGAITDLQMTGTKNTNGLTIEQLAERAKKNGWKVTTYDDKQLKDYDAKRAKDREETNKFLNHHDAKDRSNTYRAPRKGWKGH